MINGPSDFGASHVDYVSKWVEAVTSKKNDHRVVIKFLKENMFFSRFRVVTPRPERVYGMCNRRVAYVHQGLP